MRLLFLLCLILGSPGTWAQPCAKGFAKLFKKGEMPQSIVAFDRASQDILNKLEEQLLPLIESSPIDPRISQLALQAEREILNLTEEIPQPDLAMYFLQEMKRDVEERGYPIGMATSYTDPLDLEYFIKDFTRPEDNRLLLTNVLGNTFGGLYPIRANSSSVADPSRIATIKEQFKGKINKYKEKLPKFALLERLRFLVGEGHWNTFTDPEVREMYEQFKATEKFQFNTIKDMDRRIMLFK